MPKDLPYTDPDSQLARFRRAVELIGGVRSAARELGVSDRTIYGLIYAKRNLHDGFLRDMAAALIRHADACRAIERQLSPAFIGNLTAQQQTAKPHFNRYDQRGTLWDHAQARKDPKDRTTIEFRGDASDPIRGKENPDG